MTITLSPDPVDTITHYLVEKCRQGKFEEVRQTFYSADIVSIESMAMPGSSKEVKGLSAVSAKGQKWAENTDVHPMEVSEPMVAGSQFAVKFTMDVTCKQTQQRNVMQVIALYQVENGKIVCEQFFYDTCEG